jgi:hypothetical protein
MGKDDRHRHEFGRLVGGIAEHQSLVAGTAGIHAHRNIARLLVNGGEDGTGVVVEPPGGVAVADILNDFANDIGNLDIGLGGDFSGHEGNPSRQNRLAGHAGEFVLGDDGVEDSVRDLVGDLIRVSFSDRLRGEQIIVSHRFLKVQWRRPHEMPGDINMRTHSLSSGHFVSFPIWCLGRLA